MSRIAGITVIVPVYNLAQRGLERVWYSLYSISLNSVVPGVVVMDGSSREQHEALHAAIQEFSFVEHVHYPQQRYNMPILYNRGIERSSTPFLFGTGADFLYRRDFFEQLAAAARKNRFIIVSPHMLPEFELTRQAVVEWSFPPSRPNSFQKWADGLQCFHRAWYAYAGGYDERMYGWGGMDNDHHFRAQRHGLDCHWLAGSEVLHVWHRTEKALEPDQSLKQRQSHANWHLRDSDRSIKRNQTIEREIRYQITPDRAHSARVFVRDQREQIQASWMQGEFFGTQSPCPLSLAAQQFQGGTFVDVGAGIGNDALFFALCCNAARVFAFEPAKDLYDHLVENLRANELDTVDARNVALGAAPATVGLCFPGVTAEYGGALAGRVDESGSGVPMKALDDVLSSAGVQQVDCIKIDVQGHTLPVLQGARHTIRTCHPAVFCTCETPEQRKEVDDFLSSLGYAAQRADVDPQAGNSPAIYVWEDSVEAELAIVITTYNRPKELARLLKGLMADAGDLTIRCLIYNDASTAAYTALPPGTPSFHIEHIRLAEHHGKREYWKIIDRAYHDLRRIRSPYYMQLPDDVRIKPGFLRHAIRTYESIADPQKICLNLYLDEHRIGKANWTRTLPSIVRFGDASAFKLGWVDMCFISDRRFFEALDFTIRPVPSNRWQRDPRLSSGVGLQITQRLGGRGMYQVRECFIESADGASLMNPSRRVPEDLSTTQLDPIVCGVASIPDRRESLRLAVESVLPFVDELHVYLNGYPDVPDYLSRPKVTVCTSQDHGDQGDAGKFYAAGQKRGFYIAIDDDIVYPEDFVWKCINAIRQHRKTGRRVAVGFHGKVMARRVEHYYRDHVMMYHSTARLEREQTVHILGTCGVAFHSDDLPLTFQDLQGPMNMADIHFGIACQRQGVACIALPRPQGYLRLLPIPAERTIWGQFHRNDKTQTDLYNSWAPWQLRTGR